MNNYYDELPKNYQEDRTIDVEDSKLKILLTIASLALFLIVFVSIFFIKFNGETLKDIDFWIIFVFLGCYLIYLILHELTHGLFYKIFTRQKLVFGANLSFAYCGLKKGYVNKKTALFALLSPFVIHSIWMLIVLFLLPDNQWAFLISILFASHVGGCAGDLYDAYLLIFSYAGTSILMQDSGMKQIFYVPKIVDETSDFVNTNVEGDEKDA